MPIDITCPSCGTPASAPDKLRGKTVKCQRCEQPIKVVGPSMVVPMDAALLQEAQAHLRPKPRPTTPTVNPHLQPRVADFSFKYMLLSILVAGSLTFLSLVFALVVMFLMKR